MAAGRPESPGLAAHVHIAKEVCAGSAQVDQRRFAVRDAFSYRSKVLRCCMKRSPYHLHTFTIPSAHVRVAVLRERNVSTVAMPRPLISCGPVIVGRTRPSAPRGNAWG